MKTETNVTELIDRLRKRAAIRRSIPRGEPDRISDILEEAAAALDGSHRKLVQARTDTESAGKGTQVYVARLRAEQTTSDNLRKDLADAKVELDWVKDVLAQHGYVGPLAPACCPLADWIKNVGKK